MFLRILVLNKLFVEALSIVEAHSTSLRFLCRYLIRNSPEIIDQHWKYVDSSSAMYCSSNFFSLFTYKHWALYSRDTSTASFLFTSPFLQKPIQRTNYFGRFFRPIEIELWNNAMKPFNFFYHHQFCSKKKYFGW